MISFTLADTIILSHDTYVISCHRARRKHPSSKRTGFLKAPEWQLHPPPLVFKSVLSSRSLVILNYLLIRYQGSTWEKQAYVFRRTTGTWRLCTFFFFSIYDFFCTFFVHARPGLRRTFYASRGRKRPRDHRARSRRTPRALFVVDRGSVPLSAALKFFFIRRKYPKLAALSYADCKIFTGGVVPSTLYGLRPF